MSTTSFKFEELDDATREYLHDVRTRAGKGMPGIFVNRGNSKPVWAILIGPVIGIGLFILTIGSIKDAWATAMLQTAGLLIGAWLTLYAFRRWTAGRSKIYGGYFLYLDPLHIYDVAGENITIISLDTVKGVVANAAENGARVDIDLGYDQYASLNLSSMNQAVLIEDYYQAMADLERQEDGKWVDAPLAELGAAAKYTVENEEVPSNTEQLDLDVPTVPREPGATNKAGWGFGAIFSWMLVAAGLYGVLWMANIPLQDEFAFSDAKAAGAPGLRAYLLDPRNNRHRDEAKQLLATLYDKPIAAVRSSSQATPPINPKSRDGLILILEALKTTEGNPIVTLKLESTAVPNLGRDNTLQTDLADSLGQVIGQELIAFAAPGEANKAHILIKYRDAGNGQPISASVFFRLDPDSEKADLESHFTLKPDNVALGGGMIGPGGTDQLAVNLSNELSGGFRSRPIFVPDFD
jgi:hypothetical protein